MRARSMPVTRDTLPVIGAAGDLPPVGAGGAAGPVVAAVAGCGAGDAARGAKWWASIGLSSRCSIKRAKRSDD